MLRDLIAETLALWDIEGSVEQDDACAVVTVRTDRMRVRIEPAADPALPFRWLVRWRSEGEAAPGVRERHPRACASIVGVLAALRSAFGIERGPALRIASAAVHPSTALALRSGRAGVSAPSDAARENAPAAPAFVPSAGADAPESKREPPLTPIVLLTGFLGSGKTTLLSGLLRDPSLRRTAVIINEFGEVGLDHELVEASDESFIELSNGCLCCTVRSDLVLTLRDLAARRAAGALPPFERVVIETTGLADPGPILNALSTDSAVAELYALEGVIATVDAVTGSQTLAEHAEAVCQAALADCILVTKTDVPEARTAALTQTLATLNTGAPILAVANGAVEASTLFDVLAAARASGRRATPVPDDSPRHLHGIGSIAIVRDAPVRAATLPLFLTALAENLGVDLLRVKGIVGVAEAPHTPAVIHGVRHVYHAPSWLERWPGDDRRTRIVLIGRRLHPRWVSALLDAIDGEVAQAANALGSVVA